MRNSNRMLSVFAAVILLCSLSSLPAMAEYTVQVPVEYEQTGTLPIYKAIENDFTAILQPEWFNQSGVAERRGTSVTVFQDHAELTCEPDTINYEEHTDELYDYNRWERENGNPDLEPELLPREALSRDLVSIASTVYMEMEEGAHGIELEQDQLTLLSLAEARQTAEAFMDRLGLKGYDLAWALDMSLNRIRTLGEAYNTGWFSGAAANGYMPRIEYENAAVEDEGYYLYYTPLGVSHISDGRHQISLFVNSRGIAYAQFVCYYIQGEAADTPAALITPEEAVSRFTEENAKAKNSYAVKSVDRVALTYVAVRAENKKDGVVFTPVWQISFTDEESNMPYRWADINAVNGSLVDAIFR